MRIVSKVKVFAFLLLSLASTRLVSAQGDAATRSCVEKIPIGEFTRVPIALRADADVSGLALLPAAQGFAQAVAMKMREIIGGSASALPRGDSVVEASRLSGEVVVTARRNKVLTWKPAPWSRDTAAGSAVSLLGRAIDGAVKDGDGIPLPENFKGDNVSFRLSLSFPFVDPHTSGLDYASGSGALAFTLLLPWGKHAERVGSAGLIPYPQMARPSEFVNSVRLAFTIDKNGHPIPESASELWPYSGPVPNGPDLFTYRTLARSIRANLRTVQYSPAALGGCPVEEIVTQEFRFAQRPPEPGRQ